MATGVLALLTGTATRLAQFYGGNDKTYEAEIALGMISDSYDIEGEVTATGVSLPGKAEICQALERFRGRFGRFHPRFPLRKSKGLRLTN